MNITKFVLSVILLTLLIACSEVNDEINVDLNKKFTIHEIFGIHLGTINKELPEGYIIENKEITFIPDKLDNRFAKYTYSTTPKSHIIYGITSKGPRELSKDSCLSQRNQLIQETLNKLGGNASFKITEEKNKWKVREANQRQVTIDCEMSTSPDELQLVLIYQDTALSVQAFKEWKKRQKDITLIRF